MELAYCSVGAYAQKAEMFRPCKTIRAKSILPSMMFSMSFNFTSGERAGGRRVKEGEEGRGGRSGRWGREGRAEGRRKEEGEEGGEGRGKEEGGGRRVCRTGDGRGAGGKRVRK